MNRRATAPPILDTLDVSALDLTDPRGMARVLAEGIARLAALPFDTGVAHAMSALIGTARTLHESSVLTARLDALEATLPRPSAALGPRPSGSSGWLA